MPDTELDDLTAQLPEGWTCERNPEDGIRFDIHDGLGGGWCADSVMIALIIAEEIERQRAEAP